MNTVNLVGRLTKDVELKQYDGGNSFARFSVAVQRKFKSKSGDYEADFINCVSFGKTAEFLEKYFAKGQWIGITGKLQSKKWDEDGTTRYGMEVIADSVFFTSEKRGGSSASDNTSFAPQGDIGFPENTDDLPF